MKIQSRYEYDPDKDLLGKGGFARVFRAQDTLLDRYVALKVFSNSQHHNYSVLTEIKKVIQFEHPNLLRYFDVILLEHANALGETEQTQIGVMELANAGDLKDFARANPGSPLLYKLLKDVLLGLEYLHSKGIIHRDLKAQNILLVKQDDQLTAKISDFGISKDTGSGGQSSSMMVGTIEYMAPEQFSPAKYGIDGKVGSNLDLWSFGIMVHELLTNTTPFGSRDGDTTAEQIMSQILSTEMPDGIDKLPEPYKSVVKKCLVTNAKERIRRASELVNYFEHDTPLKSAAQSSQVGDDATKMYPKEGQSAQQKKPDDDATRLYPKAGETAVAQQNDFHASKIEAVRLKAQKKDKQSLQEYKGKNRRGTLIALLIGLVLSASGLGRSFYLEQQQAKAAAEIKAKEEILTKARAAAEARAIDAFKAGNHSEALGQIQLFGEPRSPRLTAMFGDLKLNGWATPRDIGEAHKLFTDAANQGDAWAQYQLAHLLIKGEGVAKNTQTAANWMEKAANAGIVQAENDYGYMHQNGIGTPRNENKAIEWYTRAAKQSHAPAWYNLGFVYHKRNDMAQARKAYQNAIDLGHEKAKEALSGLK
jgi:serine/threonine protein kinase